MSEPRPTPKLTEVFHIRMPAGTVVMRTWDGMIHTLVADREARAQRTESGDWFLWTFQGRQFAVRAAAVEVVRSEMVA